MTRKEWIEEQVHQLSREEFVDIWNEFCDSNNTPDDFIYRMDEFNDMFKDVLPADIADMVACGNFNVNDDYFVVSYNCVKSDCEPSYLVNDYELVDDIDENTEFYKFLRDKDYEEFIKSEVFNDDDTAFGFFMGWFSDTYIEGTRIITFNLDDILSDFQEAHP